jgi:hypothetical protein
MESRKKGFTKRRGEYIVHGPNKVWCVDGYCKLDFVGIEIYGCVDAYSRKIIWVYVGVSVHTQISVVSQYLKMVGELGFMSQIVRSDRGVETPMLADGHYTLRLNTEGDHTGLLLQHCYYFGKSTKNIRIESWWRQLCRGQLQPWLVRSPMLSVG